MAMEKSKDTFRMILIGALFFITGGFTKIMCPEMVAIEKGNNAIVSCNITGKEIVSVYWYTGDPAFKSPILRLENGKFGGTEYDTGHYDISSNGAMIINNASILHESVYTVLMYFSDRTRDSRHIKINITISPFPSCPVIDVCVPCEECRLAVNDTGKLTCSISGVRPVIPLKWVIKTENGVNIIEHPPVVETDVTSDTWYTSVEISYALPSCGQEVELQCEAQDRFTILEDIKSSVSIYKENCTDDKTAHSAGSSSNFIIIMSVGIVVVVTVSVIFMIRLFVNRCKNNSYRPKGLDQPPYEEEIPLNSPKAIPNDVHILISHLKSKYETSELFNPKLLKEPIEEVELNPDCHCKVKLTNGEVFLASTDELPTSRGIKNEDRVLIAGNHCYWKTMFTKKIVKSWAQNTEKENFILLYISKTNVNVNMNLINFLQQEISIKAQFLVKALEKFNCILLFDGLCRFVFDDNNHSKEIEKDHPQVLSKDSSYGNQSLSNLTLLQLFKRSDKMNGSKIKIWINSCNVNAISRIFPWPFVIVYSHHVDKAQFADFMEKICVPLFDSSEKLVLKRKLNNSNFRSDNKSSGNKGDCKNEEMNNPESVEQISKKEQIVQNECRGTKNVFRNFVKLQNVYEDFNERPFLLSRVAHIMVKEYLATTSNTYVVENTTKEEIICKLIDSLQKTYLGKQENEDMNKVSNIDTSLGKLALHLIHPQENFSALCDDDIELSLEIGFLQYSKDIPETYQPEISSSNCVQFSHTYFKFYFAAVYIVLNKQYYTTALSKSQDPECYSVLKFLIHLERSSIRHLFEALRAFGMDDDVIDCFKKWRNQEEVTPVMMKLHGQEIKVTRLDNMGHCEAFKSFCSRCRDTKITLTSLTISGSFSVSFLAHLQLPINETLEVRNVELEEKQFLGMLRWLSEKKIVLRFVNCTLPEKWSNEFKKSLKSLQSITVLSIHEDDGTAKSVLTFNYHTVDWETKQPSMKTRITTSFASPFKAIKKVSDSFD